MNRQEAARLPRLPIHDEDLDLPWKAFAECIGKDDEKRYVAGRERSAPVFFSDIRRERHSPFDPDAEAKAVCAACPVIEECLAHALAVPERYGVWGGLGERERERLRKGSRNARRPA